MSDISNYLREDWMRAREALRQQVDAFESGWAGASLTPDENRAMIDKLLTAAGHYDTLLESYRVAEPETVAALPSSPARWVPPARSPARVRRLPDVRRFGFAG